MTKVKIILVTIFVLLCISVSQAEVWVVTDKAAKAKHCFFSIGECCFTQYCVESKPIIHGNGTITFPLNNGIRTLPVATTDIQDLPNTHDCDLKYLGQLATE